MALDAVFTWVAFAEDQAASSRVEAYIRNNELKRAMTAEEGKIVALKRPAAHAKHVEDRFYCLHNAVRSAQLGEATVPPGFHPLADGGAIHERRHSLTGCLSPGTDWDDTDLST